MGTALRVSVEKILSGYSLIYGVPSFDGLTAMHMFNKIILLLKSKFLFGASM